MSSVRHRLPALPATQHPEPIRRCCRTVRGPQSRDDRAGATRRAAEQNRAARSAAGSGWPGRSSAPSTASDNRPAIVLLPSWQIIDSRFWKLQIGPLARHFRVISYDGRGHRRIRSADRPGGLHRRGMRGRHPGRAGRHRYRSGRARRAVLRQPAGRCNAAADHPDRVAAILAISPSCGFPLSQPRDKYPFDGPLRREARLGDLQQVLLAGERFPRISGVLLRRDEFRAAFQPATRGLPGLVGGLRSGACWSTPPRAGSDSAVRPAHRWSRCAEGCAARSPWCTAPTTGCGHCPSASGWPNSPAAR